MAHPYPLYDELMTKIDTDNQIDTTKLCLTINQMSNYMGRTDFIEHYQEIQALIDHYSYLKNSSLITNTPCGGKPMSGDGPSCKGVLYIINDDNPVLFRIIAQYLSKYLE